MDTKAQYYAYLLRCADGSLYAGCTKDPEKRLRTHNSGKGAKYTRSRLPVYMVYCEAFATKSEAMRREAQYKRMPKGDKESLVIQ